MHTNLDLLWHSVQQNCRLIMLGHVQSLAACGVILRPDKVAEMLCRRLEDQNAGRLYAACLSFVMSPRRQGWGCSLQEREFVRGKPPPKLHYFGFSGIIITSVLFSPQTFKLHPTIDGPQALRRSEWVQRRYGLRRGAHVDGRGAATPEERHETACNGKCHHEPGPLYSTYINLPFRSKPWESFLLDITLRTLVSSRYLLFLLHHA
jgi:hypothetical protein